MLWKLYFMTRTLQNLDGVELRHYTWIKFKIVSMNLFHTRWVIIVSRILGLLYILYCKLHNGGGMVVCRAWCDHVYVESFPADHRDTPKLCRGSLEDIMSLWTPPTRDPGP